MAVDRDALQKQTKQFVLRVFKMAPNLPKNAAGKTVANPIVHRASSIGANYRAACRARSKADFISKITVVLEEAEESFYWLELIIEDEMLEMDRVKPLQQGANEITAIVAALRATALKNHQS